MGLSCALACLSSAARAEVDLPIKLELGECPDLDATEVRRIATAELRAQPASNSGPDVLEIGVTCEGPRVVIRVKDPLSRKAVQRSFNLALSDPKARSRLVAIAATELVLASWAELAVGRPLTVPPEGGAPGEADRRVASVALTHVAPREPGAPVPERAASQYEPFERRWYDLEAPSDRMFRITAAGSTRKFFGRPGLLWGGGLRMGEERFHLMSWSADLLVESGSVGTTDNRYSIFTTTIGGALMLWGRIGPITGRIGAGLRAGVAAVSGNATSVAPWGWPLGTSSISLRITRHLVIDLIGEGGYVVLPSGRSGQPDIKGGWFSGQVGIGFVPAARPRRVVPGAEGG